MPYKRKKVFSTQLDEDAKLELERLAKVHKIDQRRIASHGIMQIAPLKMLDPDWQARIKDLEGVDEEIETYKVLEGKCPALRYLNDAYVCLWGQENAPPKIKKLTPFSDQLEDACEGCTITRDIANKIRSQEAEIRTLRAAVDVGIVGKIPQCKNGGRLKDDNKMWCPTSGTVKIEHCMTLRGGQPCNYLDMIAMSIKGELPNSDDMK